MSTTSRHLLAVPSGIGLLLIVAAPWLSVSAQDAGYRLPLVVGPQATPWKLLAGAATRDENYLQLCGGSRLVLSEYRFGDCVWELDYRAQGSPPVEPIFYFRADVAPDETVIAGPSVRLRQTSAPSRAWRWHRAHRGAAPDQAWKHLRIEVVGNAATVYVDRTRVAAVACEARRTGLLAIGVAGDPTSSLTLSGLQVTETGYTSLFNGADLSGWEGAGADAARCWQALDGLLQCTGEEGPWLRSRAEYGDFRLRLEYRIQDGGNSGVYVRVPRDGNHHGAGAGIEVQILDDASSRYGDLKPYQFSASLYAIAPAMRGSARPPGMWNSLDICCAGQRYTITHNGQVVLDVSEQDCPALSERLTRGFLGLQNHSEAVWFRHLRIGSP